MLHVKVPSQMYFRKKLVVTGRENHMSLAERKDIICMKGLKTSSESNGVEQPCQSKTTDQPRQNLFV